MDRNDLIERLRNYASDIHSAESLAELIDEAADALAEPKGVTDDYRPDEDQVGAYLRVAKITNTVDAYYLGRASGLAECVEDAERFRAYCAMPENERPFLMINGRWRFPRTAQPQYETLGDAIDSARKGVTK